MKKSIFSANLKLRKQRVNSACRYLPNFLSTLKERRSLFAGKAAFGLLEILLVTLLETGAAVLLGIVHGYTEAFPTGQLVYLFVCTLAVDAMLFFGEFLLMLWVGNPLPALCVGKQDCDSTRSSYT